MNPYGDDMVIDDQLFLAQIAPIIADAPEIISESIDEMEADIAAVNTAIASGVIGDINHAAHRLVSSAGALAAQQLMELARSIDEQTRAGVDATSIYDQVPAAGEAALAALRHRLSAGG